MSTEIYKNVKHSNEKENKLEANLTPPVLGTELY
jgi:hypothetical protein